MIENVTTHMDQLAIERNVREMVMLITAGIRSQLSIPIISSSALPAVVILLVRAHQKWLEKYRWECLWRYEKKSTRISLLINGKYRRPICPVMR